MKMTSTKATGIEPFAPIENDGKVPTETLTVPIEHTQSQMISGNGEEQAAETVQELQESKKGYFAYLRTRNFYIVLLLG